MKKNWTRWLIVLLLLALFLTACTDKPTQENSPDPSLPEIGSQSGEKTTEPANTVQPTDGPASEPEQSNAPDPAETDPAPEETSVPPVETESLPGPVETEPATDTEEPVTSEYVFEIGEGAGIGGN